MAKAASWAPDWISPPGETIEDLLEELGWKKSELAERTGFTAKHVNELVKGRAGISADTAERLARVLGSSPGFWLGREAQYRAALGRRQALEKAEAEAPWLRELPVAWMIKKGWLKRWPSRGAQVVECLTFFGVASVDAWRAHYQRPLAAFRASEKFDKRLGSVATWLREGERRATAVDTASFDAQRFRQALAEFRTLTLEAKPAVFVPELVQACAACGVAVAFVPAPSGCPASGATRWLGPDKAMLLLSLRYKTNDHLWFTFFHEAAHLLLHGKRLLFIEGIDGLDEEHETEANRFARDQLIPPTAAARLEILGRAPKVSKASVRRFAASIEIAPGIVVGRMQREGWLPYSHMNDLKVRYRWEEAA